MKQTIKYYLVGLYHRTEKDHMFLFGAGLAFSLFVCIVPLVLIVFSLLGNILESATLESQVLSFIDRLIPYSEYADFSKEIIRSRIDEVVKHKELAGLVGSAALLFAASGLFGSLRTILNTVFRVRGEESILRGKLKDFIFSIAMVVLVLISTLLLPLFEIIIDTSPEFIPFEHLRFGLVHEILFTIVSLLFIFSMFFLFYYFIPYKGVPARSVAVGALSATLFWKAAQEIFGFYLANFATLGKIYGTYVFVVVIAFWIYYSAIIFILGAEIGQLFRERQPKAK